MSCSDSVEITRFDTTKVDSLKSVRTGYDRWAAVYDHDANPLVPLEEPAEKHIDWPMLVMSLTTDAT